MPGFHEMVEGVLTNKQSNEPDFYIKTKSSSTSIYMDRATKLDIIISTFKENHIARTLEDEQFLEKQHEK